jgi:TonB-dependent receptor
LTLLGLISMYNPSRFRLLIVLLFSFSYVSIASAQSGKGVVSGAAVDPASSPLQGARVELAPSAKQQITDNQGQFRFPDVPPGDYTLTISYVGFANFSQPVSVGVSQTVNVNAVLQVASRTDEVIVRAERLQGEAESINIERNSDNIVQVLPESVINSLPNFNIADAVGRVPGVTLERDEGEGKYVQIRGTEPRLSNVTINGVHVPSPEGTVRNIKFDIISSQLVERIEVFKTLLPNQDADAIGGSVNLVTRTPSEKPYFDLSAQGGYTPIQDGRWLDVFSGVAGQRFGKEKKLGLLLGGSYDHNDRGIDDLEPSQKIGTLNGQNFAYISSEDLRTYKYNRSRYGFDGDADYNFKSGSTLYLKAFYSNFLDNGSTYVYTPQAGAPVSNNGTQTVFDNTGSAQYREYSRRPNQGVYSIVLGGNKDFSSTVLGYQFAVSHAHNQGGQDFATTYFDGPQNVTYALDQSNPYKPKLTATDGTNILDPAAYSISSGNGILIPSYNSTQLNLEGMLSLAHTYSVGSHSSTFETGFEFRNAHKIQNESDLHYTPSSSVGMTQFLSGASNPNYYGGSFAFGPLTNYNAIQQFINSNLTGGGLTPNTDLNHITSDPATWSTIERVYGGYFMDSITLGKWRLAGGLRIEGTGTSYRANKVTLSNGAYVRTDPVYGSSGYVNFMPSIQAQYRIGSDTELRLSYYRGISRPNFQDLVPSQQADPNASPASLTVGNPNLKPTKANNYDVLIEHFFRPLGIIQAGYFYKSLYDPIYATAFFLPATDPNFPGFLEQQSINGPSAHISGFEASWQQRLSFLPSPLNGLGVIANYSYADSRVTFPANFASAQVGGQGRIDHPRLQRQAPNTWNVGVTYDKSRLSMRLAVSHNDASIYAYQYVHDPTIPNVDKDPILGIKGPLGDQYLYAHTQLDVQGSYRIYKGIQATVSGLNLTNEVFGFYTGSGIYPNQREYYQRTVIFGLRWSSAVD